MNVLRSYTIRRILVSGCVFLAVVFLWGVCWELNTTLRDLNWQLQKTKEAVVKKDWFQAKVQLDIGNDKLVLANERFGNLQALESLKHQFAEQGKKIKQHSTEQEMLKALSVIGLDTAKRIDLLDKEIPWPKD